MGSYLVAVKNMVARAEGRRVWSLQVCEVITDMPLSNVLLAYVPPPTRSSLK